MDVLANAVIAVLSTWAQLLDDLLEGDYEGNKIILVGKLCVWTDIHKNVSIH